MTETYDNGRLRFDEEGGQEVYEALQAHHGNLLTIRRASDDKTTYNRRIAAVRRLLTKTEALFEEKGWTYKEDQGGELQPSDEEGAGVGSPASRGLG